MLKFASRVALVVIVAGCASGGPTTGGTTSDGATWCDYLPHSRPGIDENGCWQLPDYWAVAPEVLPPATGESAILTIEIAGSDPGWMEGGIFFIRAVTPAGRTVLETRLTGPAPEQAIPAGVYQVTMFARPCDGNCDLLDPPTLSCVVDLLAEPALAYTIHYVLSVPTESNPDQTATCAVDDQPYPGGAGVRPARLQLGLEEYFSILEVDTAVDTTGMASQPDAGNVLVAVLVEIEGLNPDGAAYGPEFFTLRDGLGVQEWSVSPFGVDPRLQSSNDLAPGDTVRGWVTFEVPEAAVEAPSPLVLVYAPGGASVFPLETSIYACAAGERDGERPACQ